MYHKKIIGKSTSITLDSGNSRNIQIVDLRRHWHHITFILTAALTFQCKTKFITYNTLKLLPMTSNNRRRVDSQCILPPGSSSCHQSVQKGLHQDSRQCSCLNTPFQHCSERPSVRSQTWITSSHEVRIGAIPFKFSWIQLSHFVLAIHKELQRILSLWLIPVGIKVFQMWHRKHQMHCYSRKGIASLYSLPPCSGYLGNKCKLGKILFVSISGHCGAAECFSVTSKMAAIKQRLTSCPFAIVMVVVGILVRSVKPQALPSGYAPGQIKICIFPQAMPQAFYCTIFALRGDLCKFLKYSPRLFPQATPQGK
ncbi:hypothetical protein T12_17089 [Trichinella patagoniensis]|uniref:Uncharacterized protein n=1 Tax=Trichinella patagoniensis TaxID=990121 RepID=A0A0V0ZI50_9BILA|nr:hypothetical protein T12_17089 [Trichinella patagoniensis]